MDTQGLVMDYECEDCIGMRDHGCYCQAMGATAPGGGTVAQPATPVQPEPLTDEQIRDLADACGLDWQKGFLLFGGDDTNRYVSLARAVLAAARQP
jgi:hypothetical protein